MELQGSTKSQTAASFLKAQEHLIPDPPPLPPPLPFKYRNTLAGLDSRSLASTESFNHKNSLILQDNQTLSGEILIK